MSTFVVIVILIVIVIGFLIAWAVLGVDPITLVQFLYYAMIFLAGGIALLVGWSIIVGGYLVQPDMLTLLNVPQSAIVPLALGIPALVCGVIFACLKDPQGE
jgi:hypothetical protein